MLFAYSREFPANALSWEVGLPQSVLSCVCAAPWCLPGVLGNALRAGQVLGGSGSCFLSELAGFKRLPGGRGQERAQQLQQAGWAGQVQLTAGSQLLLTETQELQVMTIALTV